MKTQMRQSQALKEKSPLARRLEGELQRDFLTAATHFGKERDKACGYWHGVSLFPPALGRGESNSGAGDVTKLDTSLPQAATCGHGNEPRTLHPCGFRGESGFDGGLLLGGNFGFFAGSVPFPFHASEGVSLDDAAIDSLVENPLPSLSLHRSRIKRGSFSAMTRRGRAPRDVSASVVMAHSMGSEDVMGDNKLMEVSPAESVRIFSKRRGTSRIEPCRNPSPTSPIRGRVGDVGRVVRNAFIHCAFCGENAGAFRVERGVPAKARIFRLPFAGNLEANPPKRGAGAFVKRCHKNRRECSKV